MTSPLPTLLPARALTHADRELETAVRACLENLARPRDFTTARDDPLPRRAAADLAGRFAAQCSGGRARLAPYRTREHPWVEIVRELHDRLAAEEAKFWAIARGTADV